jgi:hypothetical protein
MKRRALGLLLFLVVIPLFMGCNQAREASEGTVTFEIYTAGDDSETTEVETEYVSNTMEVSYYEDDTLFELLNTNFTITYEESDFGRYLTSIDSLNAVESNEYISFYINDGYAETGVDATELVDGSVYQFKLETF